MGIVWVLSEKKCIPTASENKKNSPNTECPLNCTQNGLNMPSESESDNDQDIFKLKLPFDFGFVNIFIVYDARGSV